MSDVAKWILLAAACVVMVGIIVAFPINTLMDLGVLSGSIATLVSHTGESFLFGRGLINNFVSPWARGALSGLMMWLIAKWAMTFTLKVMVWIYHFLFK